MRVILALVFAVAFALRLAALSDYTDAPNFDNPIGDSRVYTDRAEQILAGDLIGSEVYFHSSPLYAYFVAGVLWLGGGSFLVLRLIQIVLGSLGCVAVALLAGRLAPGRPVLPALAGLGAAGYGTLVLFDLDLLMIFLTVPLVVCSLLALLQADERDSASASALAGVFLGVAATDKTNLLLFVPVAAWFLVSTCRLRSDPASHPHARDLPTGRGRSARLHFAARDPPASEPARTSSRPRRAR